jgi:hypothetical protein
MREYWLTGAAPNRPRIRGLGNNTAIAEGVFVVVTPR